MAKKQPPAGDPEADGKALKKRAQIKEITQMEGDADRADGRRTRVQQRGRLRS